MMWPGAISSCACDYAGYMTAEGLVGESGLIVVAEYVSERTVSVEISTNPVSGLGGGTRKEKLRTYRVVEYLKGGEPRTATIEMWGGPKVRGKQVVLFLRSFAYGNQASWAWTGEPNYALIDAEWLLFQSGSEIYVEDAIRRGGQLPIQGSEAPFALTLTQLREMTAAGP